MAIVVAGSCMFLVMAAAVAAHGQLAIDRQFAQWLHAHAAPGLTRGMLATSALHGMLQIHLYALAIALLLAWKRSWYWVLALALAVPGGLLLNTVLKHVFQRMRPMLDDPLLALPAGFSFPSGHAAGATLLYGIAVAFLFAHVQAWQWRAVALLAAALLIAAVCISRVYLGVHYLSDVAAAVVEGFTWLAFSLTAAAAWGARRSAGR